MESFTLTSEPVYRNGFAVDFLQSFQRKHSEWWKLEVVLIPLTTDGWWRVQLPLAWWFEILYDLVFREASYDLWKRCVKGNLFFETVVNTCKYTSSPYSLFTGEHPSLLLSWRRTGRTAPIRTDSSVGFINDCEPCFWNEWLTLKWPLANAFHAIIASWTFPGRDPPDFGSRNGIWETDVNSNNNEVEAWYKPLLFRSFMEVFGDGGTGRCGFCHLAWVKWLNGKWRTSEYVRFRKKSSCQGG